MNYNQVILYYKNEILTILCCLNYIQKIIDIQIDIIHNDIINIILLKYINVQIPQYLLYITHTLKYPRLTITNNFNFIKGFNVYRIDDYHIDYYKIEKFLTLKSNIVEIIKDNVNIFFLTENGDLVHNWDKLYQFSIETNNEYRTLNIKNIISFGNGYYNCIIMTKNELFGFGNNENGQLGLGNNKDYLYNIEKIPFNSRGNIMVKCHYYSTTILTLDGIYYCGTPENHEYYSSFVKSNFNESVLTIEECLEYSYIITLKLHLFYRNHIDDNDNYYKYDNIDNVLVIRPSADFLLCLKISGELYMHTGYYNPEKIDLKFIPNKIRDFCIFDGNIFFYTDDNFYYCTYENNDDDAEFHFRIIGKDQIESIISSNVLVNIIRKS